MRLFEMRPAHTGDADPVGVEGIVLVVAETEAEAAEAIRAALGTPEGPAFPPDAVVLNDLGLHSGPEEPGSVFVNGYRVAC
jgi:hypothetical protein